jgi:hypothetical protein
MYNISMAHPVQQITKSVTMATVSNVSGTTVQVHPVATQQARVTTLSQGSVVTQPIQQIQVTPSVSIQQQQPAAQTGTETWLTCIGDAAVIV